jgi:hypothetical protein
MIPKIINTGANNAIITLMATMAMKIKIQIPRITARRVPTVSISFSLEL